MTEWSRRLGPRMRFGAFGGLSNNQTLWLIFGTGVTLTVLSKGSVSWWGLPAAIVSGITFGVGIFMPKWGMPRADWTVKAVAYRTGGKFWQAQRVGRSVEQLPRELGDVRIVPVRDGSQTVGMLRERHTLTAVAKVELHSLGLFADSDEQGRRLDAFRRILDNLAREDDERFRVSISTRRVPRRPNAERNYIRQHVVDPDSPQVASMLAVVEDTQTTSHEHEFFVAARYSIRQEEDEQGRFLDQTAAKLIDRMHGLLERFERAEIAVKTGRRLLAPRELARLIKDSFDPFGRPVRDQLEDTLNLAGTDPVAAWPDARRRHVESYQTDSACHATLWIRGWPAEEVGPGWLKPLTMDCDVAAMTVTTVLKPEKRAIALGRVKRKRSRTGSLRIVRRQHGQEDDEEQSERAEFLDRQAGEMVHGGASAWWWETYVTVSAPTSKEVAVAVQSAEEACAECGLTPVLLRFAQAEAFTFTLPLCRGLEPENARL